jgi:hypothetical protein
MKPVSSRDFESREEEEGLYSLHTYIELRF